MITTPFQPLGNTVAIAAGTTAGLGLQANNSAAARLSQQHRIYNANTVVSFVGIGITPALAQAAAVIPTTGAPAGTGVIPIGPGAERVISFPAGSCFSAIATVAGTIYVTPCEGI